MFGFLPAIISSAGKGVELIGVTYSSGDTVSVPEHRSGDLLLVFGGRTAQPASSVVYASVPDGWTQVDQAGATNYAQMRSVRACQVIGDGSLSSVTMTNAYRISCYAFRNAAIGATSKREQAQGITSPYFEGIDPIAPGSWVVGACYFNAISADPTDMVRGTGNMTAHTNGPVSSFPRTSFSLSDSGFAVSLSIEIQEA